MIVKDPYVDICPVYNQKVSLNIYFSKIKASPKDVGFTYKYQSFDCDFRRAKKRCPHVECPLVEMRGLRRSIRE